ncbi:MAG: GAF domain-containing protein [Tissierellia bacterium]|nr:GAF domain-containing protein [Tissierellia bacterium]
MSFIIKGIDKLNDRERYEELISYIKAQLEDENDKIALMSNISAFIMALINDLNWAGFYLVEDKDLVLGPFQGLPACTRLDFSKGVVAKAYRDKKILKIDNVDDFKGHIACDFLSKSELVIPIKSNGSISCLIDLDSPKLNRFTDIDVDRFRKISELLTDKL